MALFTILYVACLFLLKHQAQRDRVLPGHLLTEFSLASQSSRQWAEPWIASFTVKVL